MTVAALSPEASYQGDGVTVAFPAPFRFLAASLQVDLIDGTVTRQVEDVDYTVSGGDTDAGGTVTMNAAPAVGARLRIRRATPRAQQTDYEPNGTFPASSNEEAVDRMMLIDQEQDVRIDDTAERAPKVPDGETIGDLPALDDRKSRVAGYDGNGEPTAGPLLADIVTALAVLVNPGNAQAAENVLYTALATGASANSLEARARAQAIVPGDFLIDSTGGTACQDEFDAMILASADVRLPIEMNGRFLLEGPVTMRSDATITGNADYLFNHAGAGFVSPAGATVGRLKMKGDLRLMAQQTVAIGLDMNQWQYAELDGLRFMTNGAYFTQAAKLSNVAYWNKLLHWEIEGAINGIIGEDCNNLTLDDINMVKFGNIGMKTFLTFSGPVSAVKGTNLSVESIFASTTLVKLDPGCKGIDLEFLRIEGRSGTTTTNGVDFNGGTNNRVVMPVATGNLVNAVLNDSGNIVIQEIAPGVGLHRMGNGYLVAPTRSASLLGGDAGGMAFITASADGIAANRFVGITTDPREFMQSPFNNDYIANGFQLKVLGGITDVNNEQLLGATRAPAVGDAVGAAGATPTKAEFDAFVTKFNTLLDVLGTPHHGLTGD